jgi:hypothetical protein
MPAEQCCHQLAVNRSTAVAGNVHGAGCEVWLHQYRTKQSFINPNSSNFENCMGIFLGNTNSTTATFLQLISAPENGLR